MTSKTLSRLGSIGGILYVVLQLTGQMMIQVGGQEPPFNANENEILEFFSHRDPGLAPWGSFITLMAMIPFIWFLGVLWKNLKSTESENNWLSLVAVGSGFLIIAIQLVSGTGWTIAFYRFEEILSDDLLQFQFDFGNYLFSLSWVMMGSLVLATGCFSLTNGIFPKWLGWFSIILSVLLFIATAGWFSGSELIFFPVMLFWLWLIIVSVRLFINS